MDVPSVEIANAAFGILLIGWFLVEIVSRVRVRVRDDDDDGEVRRRGCSFSGLGAVLVSLVVALIYFGFGVYGYCWDRKVFSYRALSSCTTWFMAAIVAFYSNHKFLRQGGGRRWPLVLVCWGIFCCIFSSLAAIVYAIARWKSVELLPYGWLPMAEPVDLAALPFSVLLCFNLSCGVRPRAGGGLREPLLRKENDELVQSWQAGFSDAGIWNLLSFGWLNPLFRRGRNGTLELSDIPPIPRSESSKYASSLLEESLGKRKAEASNFPKAIALAVGKSLAINGVFAGINTVASYIGPFLIASFVNFLSGKRENSSHLYGLILACIFFLSKTVESLTQRQWYFGAQRIGIRVRAALMVLVYKKSLSVNAGLSNGKMINMINVDVERIGDFCWNIHGVWLLPFQVFLALVILYRNLGAAPSLAAFSSTILVMISNTPLGSKQEKFHSKIMEAKDWRIKATSETLKSMRVLKLYSWEPTFLRKLLELRETERFWLRKYLYISSATVFLFWASPTLVSIITFSVCILLKTPLTTGTVLSALATFRILQEPIYNLPELISMITQTKVSVDRIYDFLREEDQRKITFQRASVASNIAIDLEAGDYAWEPSDQMATKPIIKLTQRTEIMKGSKVAICGPVGCGKSSLLCSILGEIHRISGAAIIVYGTKAYVPQNAWIQTGTVRENILFGRDMNETFYEDVVEGCALNQDIGLWDNGDLTMIGERGLNMSGGQKQRIQLARAAYSDSDVYILDDPFCAVDAHTGTHLFKKCLMGLLAEKTIIYATHQLEFLDAADLILVMKDGMIVQSGKYDDLISDTEGELVKQMAAHSKSVSQVNAPAEHISSSCRSNQANSDEEIKEKYKMPSSHGMLKRMDEETEVGRVKWSVYSTFVTAAYKGALVPVILLFHVLFQGLQMGSNYWIAWGSEEGNNISKQMLLGIFILLSGGSSIFILGRTVLLATIAIETSQCLFIRMITSIFRAPIQFFDSTPSSKILLRSSMDQSTVDTDIPYRVAGLAFALIQLLSIIVLMSQVAWEVFLLFLVIIGLSLWYQAYYITTARELARMVGIRKGPILQNFSESIAGASIIRGFNQEDRFLMKNMNLIDDYSRVVFHNTGTMEWLSVRVNFLFNLGFFLVLIILVNLPKSAIDPSLAGLVATYGLNLNVLQAWVIWNVCNVENKMISVERILQFTSIPSEAPLVIEECKPNPEWPLEGRIDLTGLCVQYSPALPLVLKGITCTIPGGKKIGVVGRTGSGKSTLIQALFRVVEATRGDIIIDGVDISKIGLQDLRSRLGIIPQEPTLFQGTVRINLDPLEEHTDLDIWEVLKKCRLEYMVRQDRRLLDAPVAEDGKNWSVGQRQLVCLARVLLKKRKILVLDEATASIDTGTDNIIQQTIREETVGCTVITVAHRIPTVVDNDLVMVLDEGKILEYDSPRKLLENSSSSFTKLVAEFLWRTSTYESSRRVGSTYELLKLRLWLSNLQSKIYILPEFMQTMENFGVLGIANSGLSKFGKGYHASSFLHALKQATKH